MCTPACVERGEQGVKSSALSVTSSPSFWPPAPGLRRDEVRVSFQGGEYIGHLVAPPASAGKRPLVLVIHNFQGLKFFDVHQAEFLARVGYVGLAVDVYGDLFPPEQRLWPDDMAKAPEFLKGAFTAMASMDRDCGKFRAIMKAWLDAGLAHPTVDASLPPAAIGYCFGGVACLECVRGGLNLGGVVSFHGLLQTGLDGVPERHGVTPPATIPCENSYNTKTVVLVENGAHDELVPGESMVGFFTEMDAAGVDWILHHHARTPHGFALPPSLGPPGCLHEASDRRSTENMLTLFREIFPGVPQCCVDRNAAGTKLPPRAPAAGPSSGGCGGCFAAFLRPRKG